MNLTVVYNFNDLLYFCILILNALLLLCWLMSRCLSCLHSFISRGVIAMQSIRLRENKEFYLFIQKLQQNH